MTMLAENDSHRRQARMRAVFFAWLGTLGVALAIGALIVVWYASGPY